MTEPVLIDTNVFVIDLRHPRDRHFEENRRFLRQAAVSGSSYTTIINLLEVCGILSFNLNESQLLTLRRQFEKRYGVTVLPSSSLESRTEGFPVGDFLGQFRRGMSLGDALFLLTAQEHARFVTTLITWDSEHFQNRFAGRVLTPAQAV